MDESEKRERQRQREENAISDAVANLKKQVLEQPENTIVGRCFLRKSWQSMATLIENRQARISSSHRSLSGTPMLALDAGKLAFITIGCVLAALNRKKIEESLEKDPEAGSYAWLARNIGLHCMLEWIKTPAKEKKEAITRCGEKSPTPEAARKAQKRAEKILNSDWRESKRDVHLGDELTKIAAASDLVTMPRKLDKTGREKGQILVQVTDHVLGALEWEEDLEELATPFHLPMICEPNPWIRLEGGGYLLNEWKEVGAVGTIHLVKHSDNEKILDGLRTGDYEVTEKAVNALQGTRWRVNRRIYDLMREAERMGPRRIPKKIRHMLPLKLNACAKSVGHEPIHFPYQLDFRGRAYCLPPLVNPQGDDIGRSLLEFADGKTLDGEGVRWLKIHMANAYGASKGSLDERVKWVEAHSDQIRESAGNPFGKRWWMEADKAWRFLASAFEWDNFCSTGSSFRSHLPVTVDGTCNGFQHLSALLRNTKGATATNLTPGHRPADFYQEVAELLRGELQSEIGKFRPQATDWLDNVDINRKLVKPAVMTTPYGIGQKKIRKLLAKDDVTATLQDRKESCRYLAKKLKACIVKQFPEADKLSRSLQQLAALFANAPSPTGVHWSAPSGFRVVHETWRGKTTRVKTWCGTLVLYDPAQPERIRVRKQIKGIAPNFIHSLDAAHLMLTIKSLHEKGLRHFAAIHDGYAVHASDVPQLQEVLREEFVKIYSKDVLGMFFVEQQFRARGFDSPESPPLGDFDIELVRNSEYFFC